MKNTIMQELIDWTWHNCVPEHRACGRPMNNVFCADCMVAFVKADRLRHLTQQCSGQETPVEDNWTDEDELAETEGLYER